MLSGLWVWVGVRRCHVEQCFFTEAEFFFTPRHKGCGDVGCWSQRSPQGDAETLARSSAESSCLVWKGNSGWVQVFEFALGSSVNETDEISERAKRRSVQQLSCLCLDVWNKLFLLPKCKCLTIRLRVTLSSSTVRTAVVFPLSMKLWHLNITSIEIDAVCNISLCQHAHLTVEKKKTDSFFSFFFLFVQISKYSEVLEFARKQSIGEPDQWSLFSEKVRMIRHAMKCAGTVLVLPVKSLNVFQIFTIYINLLCQRIQNTLFIHVLRKGEDNKLNKTWDEVCSSSSCSCSASKIIECLSNFHHLYQPPLPTYPKYTLYPCSQKRWE